jgi:uncharacterized protein YndB with AHSA1/START domain
MENRNELLITREFNAPRELVFRAWTEPTYLAQWWGPKGSNIEVVKLELKPGGVFHYSMEMQAGHKIWGKFIYHEINAPEKLVFVNSFSDEQGGITRNPWMQGWPLEILNTVTLTENAGKTTLTIQGHPINATEEEMKIFAEAKGGMQQGFAGTFEQLEHFLAQTTV